MFQNSNNSQLRNVILSGLFVSLSIILGYYSKYFVGSFSLKISFLIFSSIVLGPLYGSIIWFLNDLLSNFFFNSMGIFWLDLNIVYTLEGIFPPLCLMLLNFIDKNKKIRFLIFMLIIFLLEFFLTMLIFLTNNDIKKILDTFFSLTNKKILFFVISIYLVIFYITVICLNIFFAKKYKKNEIYNIDVTSVAIVTTLTIIIFDLILFSFIRMIHQDMPFLICVARRLRFVVKHLSLDTFIITALLFIAKKNKNNNLNFNYIKLKDKD